jgi:hypothetical protein
MIIFDCKYSSRVNGTADENSDDDTVYCAFDSRRFVNETKDRTRWPFQKFLTDCMIGNPFAIDLLFLPDSAYTVPLPKPLFDLRDIFLTDAAFDRYLIAAENKKNFVTPQYIRKLSYHSYLNSAKRLSTGGRPMFFDPEAVPTLMKIKYEWSKEQFLEEYNRLYSSIVKPTLRKAPDYRIVEGIFTDVTVKGIR